MQSAAKVVETTPYLGEMDPSTGLLPADMDRRKGSELADQYASASPFPHVVIEDFLPPEILETCIKNFPSYLREDGNSFERDQERFKSQLNPDEMDPWLRTLFYGFNSRPFIHMLQNITGIKGLIPDPYFLGAGFHEISNGGHLSVHADFNHHKPMNLERRINVLIYLNKDWPQSYGGSLELWTDGMVACEKKLAPEFNRCVIFNTTSESWHGNPEPVNHPSGVTRKSIALYYYTSTWSNAKREHTTQFKVRPGTTDKWDWRTNIKETIVDLIPPMIYRQLKRGRKTPEAE